MKTKYLSALSLLIVSCSSGSKPQIHPPEPIQPKPLRRSQAVTVSGPGLPAIQALCPEIHASTGLQCSYVGISGGNLAFEVDSASILAAGSGVRLQTTDGSIPNDVIYASDREHVCALTFHTEKDNEITSSRSVFFSEAEMNGDDPQWDCNLIQNTALHETGHGLGLHHPQSPCQNDVMCADFPRRNERTFGPGDIEALRILYDRN